MTAAQHTEAVRDKAERRAKALKLLEAITEPCEMTTDGDHEWRRCRSCLARFELDRVANRSLLRELLPQYGGLVSLPRYRIIGRRGGAYQCELADTGEWVRWSDVDAAVGILRTHASVLLAALSSLEARLKEVAQQNQALLARIGE